MPLAMLLTLSMLQAGAMPPAAPVRARARQNPASYVRVADYPPGARSRNEQGQVHFELAVSPAGRVTGCQILSSSGSFELDEQTCQIMRERAQFQPARNAQDVAVPDVFRTSIRWLISP